LREDLHALRLTSELADLRAANANLHLLRKSCSPPRHPKHKESTAARAVLSLWSSETLNIRTG